MCVSVFFPFAVRSGMWFQFHISKLVSCKPNATQFFLRFVFWFHYIYLDWNLCLSCEKNVHISYANPPTNLENKLTNEPATVNQIVNTYQNHICIGQPNIFLELCRISHYHTHTRTPMTVPKFRWYLIVNYLINIDLSLNNKCHKRCVRTVCRRAHSVELCMQCIANSCAIKQPLILIDRMIAWLIGWLIDWMVDYIIRKVILTGNFACVWLLICTLWIVRLLPLLLRSVCSHDRHIPISILFANSFPFILTHINKPNKHIYKLVALFDKQNG